MPIALSDHFTYKKLFKFVIPSILMMVFTSLYGMVDGYFVSNYTGKIPFAAINLVIPFSMILSSVGFMFGTGGSAVVAITRGEGHEQKSLEYFSMIVYATIISGVVLGGLGIIFLEPVCRLLGASDETMPYCLIYGRIILIGCPFFMLQNVFQSFMVTAEKPKLGLYVTLAAGFSNMIGDYVLVGLLNTGVAGAAAASTLSMVVGGLVPLIYFLSRNNSKLRLVKTGLNLRVLGKASFNGSSELMSNISMSLVSIVYNRQLLAYAGEDGVAAYGVIMYAGFIFVAIFIGYSIGVAPVSGYHYGASNFDELHNIFTKSLKIVISTGLVILVISIVFARPLAAIFVGYDEELLDLTTTGFRIVNAGNLFAGINIFGSSFFTSLGDGITSAIISFLRTLIFQLAAVLLLPLAFGVNGIWFSMTFAEIMSLIVTTIFLVKKRPQFGY